MIEVGPIRHGRLRIPGGWTTDVPRIRVVQDDARFRRMVTSFQRFGRRPLAAEEAAEDACVALWTGSWVTKMRAFVGRAAIRHLAAGGTMETFRPEVAARVFVPELDTFLMPGKGNILLAEALREMRS